MLERASGWENDFAIPMQYSHRTMVALQTKVISDHAQHEITQEVCSRMMNYCTYPTSKSLKWWQQSWCSQLRDTYFTGHVRDQQQRYVNNFISNVVGIMPFHVVMDQKQILLIIGLIDIKIHIIVYSDN